MEVVGGSDHGESAAIYPLVDSGKLVEQVVAIALHESIYLIEAGHE